MTLSACQKCGGCLFRSLGEHNYRAKKENDFNATISSIKNAKPIIESPLFIGDGTRRRAEMDFKLSHNRLVLGFNEAKSHNLVDIEECPMLLPSLNQILPILKSFLLDFCLIKPANVKLKKKKKLSISSISEGALLLLQADNGIDISLKLNEEPSLEHRLLVGDFVNNHADVIRLSWSIKNSPFETIVEKFKPLLYIADFAIPIPQGAFLQASKSSENLMIAKVMEYLGETSGKIMDLFCGLGTFSYTLAKNPNNEIISADSSDTSLSGFQKALNANQITNISIIKRNLFKDPFIHEDFKNVKVLVIDPPRAGAHEQCRAILDTPFNLRPEKIVFISCNPKTFSYDASLLIEANYTFQKVVLVDQFVYSPHQELIALFILNH